MESTGWVRWCRCVLIYFEDLKIWTWFLQWKKSLDLLGTSLKSRDDIISWFVKSLENPNNPPLSLSKITAQKHAFLLCLSRATFTGGLHHPGSDLFKVNDMKPWWRWSLPKNMWSWNETKSFRYNILWDNWVVVFFAHPLYQKSKLTQLNP